MNGKEAENTGEGSKRRVWVITGTSSGLGRSLVQVALARGDYVIATVRNIDGVCDLTDNLETKSRIHVLKLDVTAPSSEIRAAAEEAVSKWGRVDVLVNNAGAGFLGITEEVGVEGYQKQFAVNFFGPLNVANAFLPYMRARRKGTIVFVGSRSSWRSHIPMMGTYAASKAALTAAAESLAVEVAPLNIKVLNVLPGGMQTCSWSKMTLLPTSPNALLLPPAANNHNDEAYDSKEDSEPRKRNGIEEESIGKHIEDYSEIREHQIKWMRSAVCDGDPEKCAQAIYNIVAGNAEQSNKTSDVTGRKGPGMNWPEGNLLVLGADAETNIRDKCGAVLKNLDEWRDVVRGVAADN
ncbi:hypothetical protein ACEPAI_9891 [Sanghuangporus weigelae]